MNRRRVPWFFVVVLALAAINWAGSETVKVPLGDGAWDRLMPLAGVAVGVVWQLIDRRDLTKRLTGPAVFVAIGVVLQAATGGVFVQVQGVMPGFGLIAGVVLAEQWLRRSDPRRERISEDAARSALSD